MGKARREFRNLDSGGRGNGSPPGNDPLRWVMVAGVVALIAVGFMNYTATTDLRKEMNARFEGLAANVAQIGTKVNAIAAAPAARSGPDPARVYTVKTESGPAEGPATAPVTIAEFSDFQ